MIKELIKQINELKCSNPHEVEDFIANSLKETTVKRLATINRQERRWYTIATVVYKIEDKFLGVEGAVSLNSEDMWYDDLDIICGAFEMEEVPSVTYKRKDDYFDEVRASAKRMSKLPTALRENE